jgi:hypothetical protein
VEHADVETDRQSDAASGRCPLSRRADPRLDIS